MAQMVLVQWTGPVLPSRYSEGSGEPNPEAETVRDQIRDRGRSPEYHNRPECDDVGVIGSRRRGERMEREGPGVDGDARGIWLRNRSSAGLGGTSSGKRYSSLLATGAADRKVGGFAGSRFCGSFDVAVGDQKNGLGSAREAASASFWPFCGLPGKWTFAFLGRSVLAKVPPNLCDLSRLSLLLGMVPLRQARQDAPGKGFRGLWRWGPLSESSASSTTTAKS
jgi:hypothetical protein